MPRLRKPHPPVVSKRDAWIDNFIVAVHRVSHLRDGKFLRAITALQFDENGEMMTGEAAAIAWLKRRGADAAPGAPDEPPAPKNRRP